jgi:GAF domain-containing protein
MSKQLRKSKDYLVFGDPCSADSSLGRMDGLGSADRLPAAGISGHLIAASGLESPIDVSELLHLICLAAIDAVPRAEYAGITLADRHGKLETPAATHPLVFKVDALQYQLNQGPCIDAVRGRWQARSDDLRVDVRWPKYGPRAAAHGIVSQMGIELFDEPGLIAGLNLYASTTRAFDDDTVEAAMLFAIQATHTLGRVMTQKQLTDAMSAGTTIGRATGVIMQQFEVSADRAFELLTRASRIHDLTLEAVADQILDELANPPVQTTDERAS